MKPLYICSTFLVIATCKLVLSAMTEENKAFLDGHNSRRLKVAKGEIAGQPGAAEMKAMIWDDELYKMASAYAATFPEDHYRRGTIPSDRFLISDNLYWGTGLNEFKPELALDPWFDEHKIYKYGPMKVEDFNKYRPPVGHYTQMVWSDSIYLGCAVAHKLDSQLSKYYVVCFYGPQGNMLGETPYKAGGPSYELISSADAA